VTGVTAAKRSLLAALAFTALGFGAASAQDGCTRETLIVRGTPVAIGYCVEGAERTTPTGEVALPVSATYSAPGGSAGGKLLLRFVAGEGSSRTVQDLPLDGLGLAGQTLHLTLVYAGGLVHIEGALLTPGAITVK